MENFPAPSELRKRRQSTFWHYAVKITLPEKAPLGVLKSVKLPTRRPSAAQMLLLLGATASAAQAASIEFSGLPLTTPPAQAYTGPGGGVFYNGSDAAGSFTTPYASFLNSFTDWGGGFTSWAGWAYSNTRDTTTAGYGNQYSAYDTASLPPFPSLPATYAVAYDSPGFGEARINLAAPASAPLSAKVANTTYGALTLLNGDGFAKKFGGVSGNDPDYFYVEFVGYDATSTETGRARLYLADYRFSDNSQDYVLSHWTDLDLTPLGMNVSFIDLVFGSSDTGVFGINTPTYIALAGIQAVPEPAAAGALAGFAALALAVSRRRNGSR